MITVKENSTYREWNDKAQEIWYNIVMPEQEETQTTYVFDPGPVYLQQCYDEGLSAQEVAYKHVSGWFTWARDKYDIKPQS